ncbi:amino acid-binding protein [Shimwellia pseudoproteus]|uniref:amino acid-binding protein n=1 Tax=Shimwellia pseudoproteus TaxID=570012 RepID=UPI0018EAE006|nr:amino acid-binding protein [Shimwellia pseudoproteus]MBJ3816774.1 amino acid-binding protein [Shimwellia pseudoproteus]
MFDIHVIMGNNPGALALMGNALGHQGIGLEGGGVFTVGQQCHGHFLVADGPRARDVLVRAGFVVAAVTRPVIRRLHQASPGELGKIAQALASRGINILVQYSDHDNRLILITDDDELARQITKPWGI